MEPLLVVFLSLLGGAVGAYFGAYLREKGKNLATREDVDRIVQKTEEVKAEVSGDLWVRQKRWDMRREVYSALLEALDEV